MLISCIYLTLGFSGNIGILIVTNILDCHLNLKTFVKVTGIYELCHIFYPRHVCCNPDDNLTEHNYKQL